MLGTLLILLGSALLLLTIMIILLLMIAGVLRNSPVNVKVLIASGVTGLLTIFLGFSPWGIAVIGLACLVAGGSAVLIFVWLRPYVGKDSRKEQPQIRIGVSREQIKPLLRFLKRMTMFAGIILLVDVIGLWSYLSYQGLWDLLSFTELLALLLLFEGALCGGIGGFMFLGFSEYRLMRQAALWPTLAGEQARGWKKRRLSQQKWGASMVTLGVSLILIGLLVSFLTSL